LIAGAVSLALSWYLFLPLCYSLWAAVRRAAFPWVTWYKSYFDLVEEHFLTAVWLPLPFLLLLSTAALRRLLGIRLRPFRRRPAGELRRAWRWLVRGLVWPVLVVSGTPFLAAGLAALVFYGPELSLATLRGASIHGSRCSPCHIAEIPLSHRRLPERWRPVVKRMKGRGADLTETEVAHVTAFMELRGSFSDWQLFLAKCRRCHLRRGDTPRSAEEWAMIIQRVARVSPFAYPEDWTLQLRRYAGQELAKEAPGKEAKVIFERACGQCHRLDRVRGLKNPTEVIRRMAAKARGAVDPAQVSAIARTIQELPRDGEAFKALFPHDTPVEPTW